MFKAAGFVGSMARADSAHLCPTVTAAPIGNGEYCLDPATTLLMVVFPMLFINITFSVDALPLWVQMRCNKYLLEKLKLFPEKIISCTFCSSSHLFYFAFFRGGLVE